MTTHRRRVPRPLHAADQPRPARVLHAPIRWHVLASCPPCQPFELEPSIFLCTQGYSSCTWCPASRVDVMPLCKHLPAAMSYAPARLIDALQVQGVGHLPRRTIRTCICLLTSATSCHSTSITAGTTWVATRTPAVPPREGLQSAFTAPLRCQWRRRRMCRCCQRRRAQDDEEAQIVVEVQGVRLRACCG